MSDTTRFDAIVAIARGALGSPFLITLSYYISLQLRSYAAKIDSRKAVPTNSRAPASILTSVENHFAEIIAIKSLYPPPPSPPY